MLSLRVVFYASSILAVVLGSSEAFAKSPWNLISRRFRDVDQKNLYLSEKNGPWMILATSFAGDGAEEEAKALVVELRERFKLPAYMHKQHYDFSDLLTGIGVDRYNRPKRMRYKQNSAYDEYAVLVGNFVTVDDHNVADSLKEIKYAKPKCLEIKSGEPTTRRFAGLRAMHRRLNGDVSKRRKGQMGSAFVTRNPLLPKEYFAPQGVDAFVYKMNQGVEHSLLKCPGKFSVRVATFRGNVIIDQTKVQRIEQGGEMETRLQLAAEKAHRLTEELRKRRIEAYEFHDRHESIVTVGSFQDVGPQLPDGRIDINPAIYRIMKQYGPQEQSVPGGGAQTLTGLQPQKLAGISFDVQPYPVQVPRRSIAGDYARGLRL